MPPAVYLLAETESFFPHLNASLNLLAGCLLVIGYVLIRRRQESAHKATMLTCFGVSVLFLASYLYYHIVVMDGLSKPFPKEEYPTAYWVYIPILLTHVLLAAVVPVLALITIVLGFKDKRAAHRKFAKITFPIWLYVSITGVVVYVMLYWMFTSGGGT